MLQIALFLGQAVSKRVTELFHRARARYSYRNATRGSTFAARLAGIKHANSQRSSLIELLNPMSDML